ncbi:MAG TPA: hypothetical protein VM533_16710 [Fimbriiglobus sp.]|jgi:ElaB/YqjD/DUF883 family membrane-anchored ribosome-binding protein|nr:hypothetical protein [Fimbriiglobus sp.]
MDHENPEVIEQEMEATRASLTDKVAALEQQVMGTIQNASDTVSDIVDSVKTMVPETLTSVKDTLTESVEEMSAKMKTAFDLGQHTRDYPWAMVGGAAALGFVTGLLAFGSRSSPSFSRLAAASPQPHGAPGYSTPPLGVAAAAPRRPTWMDELMDRIGKELLTVGEAAIASASASLKQSVQEGLPKLIGPEGLGIDGRTPTTNYPHPANEAERMRDQRPL